MPLFWFMIFTNRIKRIRDKTFCFDIRLRPNPRTWHTSRIHGVGCNSEKLRWISYVQISTFVAQDMRSNKFALPELVLPIVSKRWVTHYPRVNKKKNKGALTSLNKQTRGCSYELKRIHISGVHLGPDLKLLQVVLVFHIHLYLF